MQNDQPRFFDERAAAAYDDTILRRDADAAVAFLERLARGGARARAGDRDGPDRASLVRLGIRVDGIDLSPAMVDRLRANRAATSRR